MAKAAFAAAKLRQLNKAWSQAGPFANTRRLGTLLAQRRYFVSWQPVGNL
jgi:hypothetical protein